MATDIDPAEVMPHAILRAADFRNARVLEVGAADGRLTFQYASESLSVTGIDTKETEIRTAVRKNLEHVQFLCASATALPFPTGHFDIVLLASSL